VKAAVITDYGKVEVKDVQTPEPGRGEVLVKVKACGLCDTDYKAFVGKRKNFEVPVIMGHEMSGTIVETGPEVDGWKSGDDVILSPVVFCGECKNCRLGLQHYCQNGIVLGGDGQPVTRDGGFAEYVAVPTVVLFKKPESVSFPAGALTEPLAGSYKGMIEYSELRLGEDVVIIGVGGMGLLLTQVAARGGAGRLIALDLSDRRLRMAADVGATHCINVKEVDDVKAAVYDILPDGPDIVFEAAGTLSAAELTFALVRRGTRVNVFGVTTPGDIPISPGKVHFEETRVDASFSITPRVMTKSIELMEKGLVDPEKIVTHTFSLDEIHDAIKMMESDERVKIMVCP